MNQLSNTIKGTSWWRWPVKKLFEGRVFFDKHFAYFFANEKVRKNHELVEINGSQDSLTKHKE